MKLIFVCDNTAAAADANLNICHRLACEMKRMGHDVILLGNCETQDVPLREVIDGVEYRRFYYPINRITHAVLREYQKSRSKKKLLGMLLRHPVTAAVDVLRWLFGWNPIECRYAREIRRAVRESKTDRVIACGGSFYTIHVLAKTNVPCTRVGYMLDPYWKNHVTGGRRAYKEELFAWRRLDRMIIPPLLEKDYEAAPFAGLCKKRITAEFPGLVRGTECSAENAEKERCGLVFAGNFYSDIRSPLPILQLLGAIAPEEKLCLTVLGGMYGTFDAQTEALVQRLEADGRLCMPGTVSFAAAQAAMRQAEILVNLGNDIENQMPSKLFEYFAAGRPIVHLQRIENDPCIPYLERYPMALVLDERQSVQEKARALVSFCHEFAGRRVPYSEVEQRFPACTPQFVAQQLLEAVRA